MGKFYTVDQVAEMVQMTPNHIYTLVRTKAIGHYKIGGSVRITDEQLKEWLDSKRVYNKREIDRVATIAVVV